MPSYGKRSDTPPSSLCVGVSVPWLALLVDSHAAIPHAAVDDDVYGGFHIPKGD